MPERHMLALLALAACATAGAAELDPASLSEARVTTIELPTGSAPGKTWQAGTLIAAPLAKLCALIQDYPAYPSFMPNTAKVVVVGSEAGSVRTDFTLSLPLGKTKQYRLQMTPTIGTQSCRLAWKMLPRPELKPADTIGDTTGYWLLTPLAGAPEKTVVRYQVYSDPGYVPPGLGWIVDMLGKDSLPKTLEALRRRAQNAG